MIQVKNKKELKTIIQEKKIPLDNIDVSLIEDFTFLFRAIDEINGNIKEWNTSNVTNMSFMFYESGLNEDISSWDTSSVKFMSSMFQKSSFNQDISSWNVSSVISMENMFQSSKFNKDISSWDISSLKSIVSMFRRTDFSHNLGAWDLTNVNSQNAFWESKYSIETYKKDRENYLSELNFKQEKIMEENILKLNKSLDKNIELTTLEMEF